jgi:N-acetylglucosaminyl-diphospho-decaprenol L-rhamnosyltransferase
VSAAPDVTVSLVNASNRELLLDCLASLPRAARRATLEVMVVDNASTDGSAEAVRAAHLEVEVIARERRHGFGANHNVAIRRARGRYVLILNEDTVLDGGCIDRMVAFMDQNPSVGACGPRLRYPDGRLQPSAYAFPTPARVALTTLTLQRRAWIQSHGEHIRSVDWLMGAAVLARREALLEVGGFDERLFMYYEDPDLCRRLRRCGWRVAFFPYAGLVHFENAATARVPERRIYQNARSRGLYARKHHGRGGEAMLQGLAAATFAVRAAVARASQLVPQGVPVRRFSPDQVARFRTHVRAALDPQARPAIEDSAADYNRSLDAAAR